MYEATLRTIALALAAATWCSSADASVFAFTFNGPSVSGALSLTYENNPNTGALPGTSPNPVDPTGSYRITGISGTFSNTKLNIIDAKVTGLLDLARVDPEQSNLLAPNSFSLLPVTNGVQGDGPKSPGLHYDNLFYPAGSPQTATDYPFAGGVFDIYGMIFQLDNGDFVNFWSNGAQPFVGLNYGVAVATADDALDYTSGVSISAIPEPATWLMMVLGFGALATTMRRQRVRVAFA